MQALREREIDLSIIIPCYNLEKFIQPMLDSLKEQELGDYKVEIIFVLNNCTDDTEGVIRRSGLDCRIIYETTQGCGPARNAGFKIARGRYVWFLDGDDWLLGTDAVKTALDRTGGTLNVVYIPFASETYLGQYFSMVAQYMMRRDFVDEFEFPDYQPAEDDAYMRQVLRKAKLDENMYVFLPRVDRPLWYYNFLREGSNMWCYYFGVDI